MDEYISFWDEDPNEAIANNGFQSGTSRSRSDYSSDDEDDNGPAPLSGYGRHFPLGWIRENPL